MGNQFKTAILLTAMTVFIILIGQMLGGRQGMIMAFVFAGAMNFFSYWFSDRIVLKMYRAREVDASQAPDLYAMVQRLSRNAGLPMPRVFVIPQETPNAFATGRNPDHAVVAVTEGLTKLLNPSEIEGVLAHELGHVKNRDILIGTIAATRAGAVMMRASMARWSAIFGGGRGDGEDGRLGGIGLIVMALLAPIGAMIIQMAISRSREYVADATGAAIAGRPDGLAAALEKLGAYSNRLPMHANPSTAHMFIVNPLSGGNLQKLFSTHPPIEERVAKLRGIHPSTSPPTPPGQAEGESKDSGRAFWDRMSNR